MIHLRSAFFLPLPLLVACGSDAEPVKGKDPAPSDAGDSGALPPPNPPPKCVVGSPTEPLSVATTYGLVQGKTAGKTTAFLGIPYAAPPVGVRRFAPPASPACWDGTKKALDYGSQCPQFGASFTAVTGNEDCLSLNVWSPAVRDKVDPKAEKLPVLFFIHGGANIAGASNQSFVSNLYDGQLLAESQHAIVVGINYRLGAFGFLAHAAFDKENANGTGGAGVSGNYGILDQISALTWVKDNIAAFGGDPGHVMIFGESAGAYNTCVLVASPLAKGLFASALMQSGTCNAPDLKYSEGQGAAFAKKVGCEGGGDLAACLRAVKSEDLVKAAGTLNIDTTAKIDFAHTLDLPFGANVDGWVLPDSPIATLRKGTHNKVPLVMGTNADELELFLPVGTPLNCFQYESNVNSTLGTNASEALKRYPCNPLYPRDAAIALATDLHFTCPTRRALRAAATHQTEPVYRYYFKHWSSNALTLRAYHASELAYVFGTFSATAWLPTPGERSLSDSMMGYWGRFAAKGEPNGASAPTWPVFDKTGVALGLDTTIATEPGVREAECDFWDSLAIE